MKGYWLILAGKITNNEAQAEYGRLWGPIATKYGARVLRDERLVEIREARDTVRTLLVEFPSIEAARACYDDPAYTEAAKWAVQASTRDLVIFEGEVALPA